MISWVLHKSSLLASQWQKYQCFLQGAAGGGETGQSPGSNWLPALSSVHRVTVSTSDLPGNNALSSATVLSGPCGFIKQLTCY